MPSAPPRRPSESSVEATHLVLPPDTNIHGTMFGGRVMQWMDIAAGIAAGRHRGGAVVTAAVDELQFARPIRMADVVIIKAGVNYAARTSMEVGVRVEREETGTGVHEHCLTGYFTFVGIDDQGCPTPVPGVIPETDEEKRRYANAEERRARRLAARARGS
jgi:acyl-CoA hydrolase